MTNPVDPNAQWQHPYPQPPVEYSPPPPFAPPGPAPAGQHPQYGQPYPPGYAPPWLTDPAALPWSPPPTPPRRHTGLIVAAVLVAVAMALGVGYFVLRDSDTPDRLAIPAAFDGYTRLSNQRTGDMESSMRSMIGGFGGGARKAFDSATIGLYANNSGDTPRLIAMVLPTSAFPSGSASSTTDEMLRGLSMFGGNDVRSYPPGPRGGSSMCGSVKFGTIREVLCAWSDSTTVGLMVSVITPMTPRRLSGVERDFRAFLD
jgi:hypothetical protein